MSFNNLTRGTVGRLSPLSYLEKAIFPTPNTDASSAWVRIHNPGPTNHGESDNFMTPLFRSGADKNT